MVYGVEKDFILTGKGTNTCNMSNVARAPIISPKHLQMSGGWNVKMTNTFRNRIHICDMHYLHWLAQASSVS